MLELKGKYNKDCKVFIDDIEPEAYTLIQSILDKPVSEGVQVRIMPDTHFGKGVVIGLSMPLTKLLSPSYIGVDIGCGMTSARFSGRTSMDLEKVDRKIREVVPMGFNGHEELQLTELPFAEVQVIADKFTAKFNCKFGTDYTAPRYNEQWLTDKLKQIGMGAAKFYGAIGTLGGGNHFIEIGKATDYWITIHSGSRNFGLKVADYWTNVAAKQSLTVTLDYTRELEDIKMNSIPRSDIPNKISALRARYGLGIDKEFLQGDNLIGYLYDMIFAQQYALWNRKTMLNLIQKVLGVKKFDEIINTTHNYVDFNDLIIRKGAISSYVGEKMIIPFNMRDGILLCEGKSNVDWNCSAPHGSGRLMSRSKAKSSVDLKDFQRVMKGVYSTSVCKSTLDESPFAYKNSDLIRELIEPTATILSTIKPVLNIKDTSEGESWKERKLKQKACRQSK